MSRAARILLMILLALLVVPLASAQFQPKIFFPMVMQEPTRTPTVTPTPTQTPFPFGDIQIVTIRPEGLQGEYVQIKNFGDEEVDMTGWRLRDEAGHFYYFPDFQLGPGANVRVWTKAGTDTSRDLFWGLTYSVWNKYHDDAHLRDEDNNLIHAYQY